MTLDQWLDRIPKLKKRWTSNQRFLTALHIPADINITVSQHLQRDSPAPPGAGVDLLPEPRTSPGPVPGRDARRTSHDVEI